MISRGNCSCRMMIKVGSINSSLNHLLIKNNSLLISLLYNWNMPKIKREICNPYLNHHMSLHKQKMIRCFKIQNHFTKRNQLYKIETFLIYNSRLLFFHTIFQTILCLPTISSRQATRWKKVPDPKNLRISKVFVASDLKKTTGRVFDLDSGIRRVFHLQSLHSAPKIKLKRYKEDRDREERWIDLHIDVSVPPYLCAIIQPVPLSLLLTCYGHYIDRVWLKPHLNFK